MCAYAYARAQLQRDGSVLIDLCVIFMHISSLVHDHDAHIISYVMIINAIGKLIDRQLEIKF